uniref:Mos1 transposase HTH domain-containing protein n=1 Tax=Acrobeloides nanus TaxID=290746 RepID=A0A914E9C4_9BILA
MSCSTSLIAKSKDQENARQAAVKIRAVYGKHAITDQDVHKGFKQFNEGNFDVEDRCHFNPGREETFGNEEIQQLLDENLWETQADLAEALDITQQDISYRERYYLYT